MSTVTITLPDGSELEVESGATVEDVAYEIGPGLGRDTVAGRVDGELVAKEEPIEADAELQIVTEGSEDYLEVLRHTASHVFAQALQRIHPEAKLAIGPATDEGFYYDVDGVELDQDDLRAIQAEMEAIIEADYDVERVELSREEALEFYEDNPYKQEILEDEAAGEGPISFYRQDDWQDLCKGPHVSSTGEVGAVELLNVSAAYWRGDEDRATLTRVYGTAFPDQDELADYLEKREQAKERDHRRLGTELELFSIPDVTGPGLPLYHPNGKTVLRELESYVTEMNLAEDYDYVETPHLFRTELWKQSGHYDNYVDDMFLLDVNDEEYGLKPMNCPGHAMIFDQTTWSYRDLPERYAEDGKVYRKEQRGELSGLSRVWAFTIDDGHLFVRPDQIEAEVSTIVDMIFDVLSTFDLEAEVALATRPEKSVGSDEIWETAESQLREVLEDLGLEYDLEEGDGAFYGPKIDFAFEDALGRTWDGPTVQLDFNMPERFDLTYTGADNEDHRPVMIHRALYGSYERFFMVLIEHFNGKFPLWLAPEQVRVLPVSDTNLEYARSVAADLEAEGFRVEVEDRDWTVGKKIQQTHEDRVPYMLVLGDNEAEAGTISVRDREERERKDVSFEAFREHLLEERDERRIEPDFLAT
ncbi:threonyl-tRNA synthetase [Halodesulfurarchaeum formicicum]|uniref:Threonine--tRNA ligase n=1 Tax=Halodesulfurarchaeum formicicum TaxID=1873524 RepID=A0A1D8S2A3_9EURY|nr:threonine--tRNA ligase [Halodesulfurarchaeum formicicum]AOW79485.1 threonyl-tRNA synthetase [Halodesulfurarchaeum formicicum]APE94737.1 threonyl-tRNA synthetase [Halodesulfurarchaeum formicicum]